MTEAAVPLTDTVVAPAHISRGAAVDVLLMTADPAVRAIIGTAVSAPHTFQHVESPDAAVDALVKGPCSILIADLGIVRGDVATLFRSLKEQFPDLVVIAIGTRDEEADAAALLGDGTVFRFLHKPASPGRARLFVTAAIQRHLEATGSGSLRLFGKVRSPMTIAAITLGLLLAAGLAAWLALRSPAPDRPAQSVPAGAPADAATAGTDAVTTLNAARTALRQGRLVAPAGDNALGLYRDVLESSPDEPEALDGLRRVIEQLFTRAEEALAAGDVKGAREPLDHVRSVRPDHPRLRFLDAQIARAQAAADAARRAALEPAETPREVEMRRLLHVADRRIAQGRLITPAGNDARHYVLQARALDAENSEMRSVAGVLAAAMVQQGEAALEAGELGEAGRWATAVADFANESGIGLPGGEELAKRVEAETARAAQAAIERHLELAAQRIDEGAWLTPPGDSARDHLIGARMQGADSSTTQVLEERLLRGMYDATQSALDANELERARELLEAAARIAPDTNAVTRLAEGLATAEARQEFLQNVVPAASLPRTRGSAPSYPKDAVRRGEEGWVEVVFTIAEDGSTKDFAIRNAEPVGVFEEAAIEAIAAWRFEPIVKDGATVEQRAGIRLRFKLEQ